jgi:hypothetical protein
MRAMMLMVLLLEMDVAGVAVWLLAVLLHVRSAKMRCG